jgi:hypothetical protein
VKRRADITAALALAAVVALFFYFTLRRPAPPDTATGPRVESTDEVHVAKTAESPPSPVQTSDLAHELNSPTTDIRADLRVVADVLDSFRSNFPRDGNPTGSNAEITAALTGKNKLHLALIPRGHPAINRQGELCDRWGTPFFFHAESGTRMEIRSAGPDKKMWTADDVVLSP